MDPKILTGILHSDTHIRLQAGEQLLEYLRSEQNELEELEELESLISGLANWMTSNNFKVSLQGMDLLIMIIIQLKQKFRQHVSTLMPAIREKLGDSKDSVREKTQVLIQQLMQDSVSSPQKFLDNVLEGALVHKNWRVKEQGLVCITRTLSFFGSGQISVSKFVSKICELLGDANAQVRSVAIETLVEIYRHVGVKVRIDLSKREIPTTKLQMVLQKFDEIDRGKESGDENSESLSSCSSNTSAQVPGGSTSSLTGKRKPPAGLTNGNNSGSSSGAVDISLFEKAYSDIPHINIFTQSDLEKRMDSICHILGNKDNKWDTRVSSLKELKAIVQCESVDIHSFLTLLKNMEIPMQESFKDLRSQVVREACITLSCIAVHLRVELSQFAEQMLPCLIALLPNSAKVMSTSASVCIKIIIQNCPSHRLVAPIVQGFQAKSAITRKSCAELVDVLTRSWDTAVLDRAGSMLEEAIVKGIKDADPTARKLMRKAFWNYHSHYPSVGDKLFNSFDSQLQKHLKDEKRQLEGEPPPPPVQLSQVKPKLKKSIGGEIQLQTDTVTASLPPRTGSSGNLPTIKIRTPTIRSPPTKPVRRTTEPSLSKTKKLSRSNENLLSNGSSSTSSNSTAILGAPARQSSSSKTGVNVRKNSDTLSNRPVTPTRQLNTGRRSPLGTREESPPVRSKSSSLSRKLVTQLTADSLKQFSSGAIVDDDDDNASVTSERSTYSMSSEISMSPYVMSKYPNPISDIDELVKLCSSKSWSERKDGIAQLYLLLESDRDLIDTDILRIKEIFKRMFSEPHIKVYSIFLETLCRFIEDHKDHLQDWLFLLLLKLLHKQGTDMLKSVQFKIQLVLELVRRAFDVSQQFSVLCRILNDQTQPMTVKVKQAWLEYVHELVPLMDSEDFQDSSEIRQAFTKLLIFTMEPKSVEIRKASQHVVTDLFELNTAVFTLLLRGVPRNVQENAERIIKGYIQENSSEDENDTTLTSPTIKTPKGKPPQMRSQTLDSRVTQSLTPNALYRHTSPETSSLSNSVTPKAHSRLPVAASPRAPPSSGRATPSRIPRPSSRQGGLPPRARSVDPERMMATNNIQEIINYNNKQTPRDRYQRPTSSQSEYMTTSSLPYSSNGTHGRPLGGQRPPSSQGFMLDHFISTLPMLDFGSPDPEGEPRDQVALLLKEIKNANNTKLRTTALQNIFTLARAYVNENWKDHVSEAMTVLIDCITNDSDALVRTLSLRVTRELIKSRPPGVTQFTEQLTRQTLECYKETDCNVSQAAEDMFSPLASAFPPQRVLDILIPIVSRGADTNSLGALKLLSKVVSHTDESTLSSVLNEMVPGIVQGYCHEESSVRKASVFCLVEIHGIVGEKIRPLLSVLSSSQTKLLDLYIKRHHTTPKNVPSHPTSSEQ